MDELWTQPVTKPGIYNMDEAYYHADAVPRDLGGSLSSTGAKKLLSPSCPAIYHYEREHGSESTKAQDLGTVVHGLVLGSGQPVEVCDFRDWTTKAAKEAKAKAIDAGRVPLLTKNYEQAEAIAKAVRDHATAGPLFSEGDAEMSGFWVDEEFGVWRRVRWDWNTPYEEVVDLKTCADASPQAVAKAMHSFGYYMQNPWYRDGWAQLLGNGEQPRDFLNVFVQTEPPYLITIARLSDEHVELGRQCNRLALERFRDCTDAGVWPAWSEDIIDISLPYWKAKDIESEIIHDY